MTATDVPTVRHAASTLTADDLSSLLEELAAEHGIVGAGLALDVGGSVTTAATGVASLRTGQPVTEATLFQIGSITKVYTATLVMTLVDEGLVAIDDPVVRHLPEFRAADSDLGDVTIGHLLCHTGGIAGDVFDDFGRDEDAIERMVAALCDMPREAPTGLLFSYCNAGWSVLGRVVEVVTGQRWSAALRERVLAPAGLTETMSLPEEVILHPFAVGHVPGEDGFEVAPVWTLGPASGPAGSLTCATPADLTRFGRLHLRLGEAADGTRVLGEASVRAMQEPRVALPDGGGLADRWGLGWSLHDWAQPDGSTMRSIGHDGDTVGQHAVLRVLPQQDVVVALAVDGGRSVHEFGTEVTRRVLDRAAGVAVPPWPTAPESPPSIDPSSVVGTYGRRDLAMTIRQVEGGGYALDVETSGAMAAIQPSMRDLPAIPLADGRLLLQMGALHVPAVVHEVGGERWLFAGARSSRQMTA